MLATFLYSLSTLPCIDDLTFVIAGMCVCYYQAVKTITLPTQYPLGQIQANRYHTVAVVITVLGIVLLSILECGHTYYVPKSCRPVTWSTTMRDLINITGDRHRFAQARATEKGYHNYIQAYVVECFSTEEHAPSKEHTVDFDADAATIGIDNRCSGCISHEINDFVGPLRDTTRVIRGFGGTRVTHLKVGTLSWKWLDDLGQEHKFVIRNSYYIPHGGVRLLSPQHWAQTRTSRKERELASETTDADKCILQWSDKKGIKRYKKTIALDRKGSNLATMNMAPSFAGYDLFCQEAGFEPNVHIYDCNPIHASPAQISDDEASDNEDGYVASQAHRGDDRGPIGWKTETAEPRLFNLAGPDVTSEERKRAPVVITDEEDRITQGMLTPTTELLLYHYRYSHIGFPKLRELAKQGVLPKRLANCNTPVCSACAYAKATKRPWRQKQRNDRTIKPPTRPGEIVSVDQMVSPVPGLIAQIDGFLTKERYKYATVFVDQATRLGFVYLQKTATAEETIKAKQAFEHYAATCGISVRAYHADNGIFKANAFRNECYKNNQPLTFAGVNAHHQNGVAERRIRELQELTRSMLVHAHKRWPEAVTINLWPYALRTACTAYNNTPSFQDKERRTPEQRFTSSEGVTANPKHFKPFGCPVYVLDEALQQGKFKGKWEERSRVGVYLGQSPIHNQTVALVLNLKTGHVSPQFHVTFDPSFHTIKQLGELKVTWLDATGFRGPDPKRRDKKDRDPGKVGKRNKAKKAGIRQGEPSAEQRKEERAKTIGNATTHAPTMGQAVNNAPAKEASEQRRPKRRRQDVDTEKHPLGQDTEAGKDKRALSEGLQQGLRRSSRTPKPTSRLLEVMKTEILALTAEEIPGEIFNYRVTCPEGACTDINPLQVFKASTDPDTMYMHEAMKESDHEEFKKAMVKEVNDQMDNGNFTVVHRSEVPEGSTILPSVWQMKRKRDIKTREVKKYKARLNIDGSKMKHGVHYEKTYAPVASWMSVKLLLAMAAVNDWHTTQIDYVLAFPQAPVEKELYMYCPRGFKFGNVPSENSKDYVLKLNRNVYGQKQAGRVWNQYLVSKLVREVGFTQSKVDECVFYRGTVVYVLYTDDSILAGPDKNEINKVISDIKKAKLDITVEGDIRDFLGVNIVKNKDGSITFSQPHLIDKILKALGLDKEGVKPHDTPARSSVLISRHSDSEDFQQEFNYRSVIGMLGYLETTRSDISYATHQCARFSSSPKVEHGKAIRWLGRYLLGTRDKGTTFRPDKSRGLEVYVDADFMGNWDPKEAANDRDTARSRHGYIINYCGCPIVTKSQLQTEVCLSTTESEYTGLSYSLREAIPIIRLLDEMKGQGIPVSSTKAAIHCKVFEDNSGALEIAKNPKYRPRTKHLNGRLHHFRSWVESGRISIHKIDTKEQCADYLTKAVPLDILRPLRKKVMGW